MSAEILPIPAIPSGLREAAARATLIPFVGAGVSRLAGCPGWSELADGALQWFVDLDKFTYAQLDQIRHLEPRVKLSLALALEREYKISIDFRKLIHPRSRREERRCCMNTRCGWGGVARTSRDPPQEPHYGDEVEGPSQV